MAFEKGNDYGRGRPRGSRNKKTELWEKLGDYLTNEGAEKAIEILEKSDDKMFVGIYDKWLEYFKPKLQRTEGKIEVDANINTLPFNGSIARDVRSQA